MFQVNIHNLDAAPEEKWTRVVCVSRYRGKWVFVKHKDRDTWEIPGGHIEKGESWQVTACREMKEETGADVITVEPIALYSISTYGLLCYAEIEELGDMIESEIEKVEFFNDLPENLTYADSHTLFFNTVKKYKGL